jgi:hypothetical protein
MTDKQDDMDEAIEGTIQTIFGRSSEELGLVGESRKRVYDAIAVISDAFDALETAARCDIGVLLRRREGSWTAEMTVQGEVMSSLHGDSLAAVWADATVYVCRMTREDVPAHEWVQEIISAAKTAYE